MKASRETVLVTGFGPFPGAPMNPTQALIRRLVRLPRGVVGGTRLVTHVFPVSYRAVDRDLPILIARHRPMALVMFGLAVHTGWLRVETRARNAIGSVRDADGRYGRATHIAADRGETLAFPHTVRALLQPLQRARLQVRMSRNAGSYLCNYLSWRALEQTQASAHDAPVFAVFIHMPLVVSTKRPCRAAICHKRQRRVTHAALDRAMPALLRQTIILARRETQRRKTTQTC